MSPAHLCLNHVPFRGHHDFDPDPASLKGHKGSPCMFGIKSKGLMWTLTEDD